MSKQCVQWLGNNLKEVIDFTGWNPSALSKWTWEEYEGIVKEHGLKIFNSKGSEIVNVGDYICNNNGDLIIMGAYKEYRKTATVRAKIFEIGDEDGFVHREGFHGALEDAHYRCSPDKVPYVSTLENQFLKGDFGKHYVCKGVNGERWLVEKSIFENTYEEVS